MPGLSPHDSEIGIVRGPDLKRRLSARSLGVLKASSAVDVVVNIDIYSITRLLTIIEDNKENTNPSREC